MIHIKENINLLQEDSCPIGIKFTYKDKRDKAYNEIKNKVKGFFIVRQKRLPITIAQGIAIGKTKNHFGNLPCLQDQSGYFTESFLNANDHGVNVLDNVLDFNVTGVVLKDIKGSICNQENRIININDGKSTICPNLLIDSYDVVSSHAAYIGKFSDDVLFYLMSKGINKKKAYELLILSFLLPEGIEKEKIENFILEVKKI